MCSKGRKQQPESQSDRIDSKTVIIARTNFIIKESIPVGGWHNTGGRSLETVAVADSVISNFDGVEGCTADVGAESSDPDSLPDGSSYDVRSADGTGGDIIVGAGCDHESKGIGERRVYNGSCCGALISKYV